MVDHKRLVRDLKDAIKELAAERNDLDDKIEVLESTLDKLGGGRGRGARSRAATRRTKKTSKRKTTKKKASKKKWTPAMRKAAADRMRAYWAKRKQKEES